MSVSNENLELYPEVPDLLEDRWEEAAFVCIGRFCDAGYGDLTSAVGCNCESVTKLEYRFPRAVLFVSESCIRICGRKKSTVSLRISLDYRPVDRQNLSEVRSVLWIATLLTLTVGCAIYLLVLTPHVRETRIRTHLLLDNVKNSIWASPKSTRFARNVEAIWKQLTTDNPSLAQEMLREMPEMDGTKAILDAFEYTVFHAISQMGPLWAFPRLEVYKEGRIARDGEPSPTVTPGRKPTTVFQRSSDFQGTDKVRCESLDGILSSNEVYNQFSQSNATDPLCRSDGLLIFSPPHTKIALQRRGTRRIVHICNPYVKIDLSLGKVSNKRVGLPVELRQGLDAYAEEKYSTILLQLDFSAKGSRLHSLSSTYEDCWNWSEQLLYALVHYLTYVT